MRNFKFYAQVRRFQLGIAYLYYIDKVNGSFKMSDRFWIANCINNWRHVCLIKQSLVNNDDHVNGDDDEDVDLTVVWKSQY